MYRRLMSSLLAVAVAASVVPSTYAAGPLPTLPGRPRPTKPTRPPRTTTVTTQTTTAQLDTLSNNSTRGTIVYQTTTVSTSILGLIPVSYSTTTLTGTINRTPPVEGNLVTFNLYYLDDTSNPAIPLTTTVLLSNGTGSFYLSSKNGDSIPVILPGDSIYAVATPVGETDPVTIQIAKFGATTTTTTTYVAP